MTALNPATDIPASVDSAEKLFVYAASMLAYSYPRKTFRPEEGQSARRFARQIYIDADGLIEYSVQGTLQLSASYESADTGSIWSFVLPVGDTSIAPGYLA